MLGLDAAGRGGGRGVAVDVHGSQHHHRAHCEGGVQVDVVEEVQRHQTRDDDGQRRCEALEHVIRILDHHCHDLPTSPRR